MENKYLIVNADDFGLTKGVNEGIIKAHKDGIVSSTTALVGADYFDEAMLLAKDYPTLNIGVHLALTIDHIKPVYNGSLLTLVKEDNTFKSGRDWLLKADINEVEKEWRAQIEKFLTYDVKLSHLDSHHNIHCLSKEYNELALKLASEYGVGIRMCPFAMDAKTVDQMFYTFYDEGSTKENLLNILDEISKSDKTYFEIMCHVAYVYETLKDVSIYIDKREEELNILTSKEVVDFIEDSNIKLIGYRDIR